MVFIKRIFLRPVYYFYLRLLATLKDIFLPLILFGRNASLIPPASRMFDGRPDYFEFRQNGNEFLKYYIELCDLQPNEKILDVGSGIGRKTVPLTRYLNQEGRYVGIDITKSGIDWCSERISKKYPQFEFHHINVFNTYYNPTGPIKATEYTFPFEDESFDFIVLGSVFTHMVPEDSRHYLSEIVRVLKKGGRCLITFFLLNQESIELDGMGKSTLALIYEQSPCRYADIREPEKTVGYDENFILNLYASSRLKIQQPILYGMWCGRKNGLSYQDMIVATK